MSLRLLGLVLALTASPATLGAAATVATPATVAATLQRAAAGTTIKLAPGEYDAIALRDRHWSPAVTIDASAAHLRGVRLDLVSGLTWHGGTFSGGDVERSGFNVNKGDHLIVDGVAFSHYLRNGIGLSVVSDVRITNNSFSDSGSDGIDVAMSRRIVIDHNRCFDFHPTDKAHPDCIQMWSHPQEPPTADVVISNNEAIGDMQGFTMFNHIRDGVDDGGFDRITVEHNFVKVTVWHGIFVGACRNCIVRHNRAESIPNPAFPRARAWIKAEGENVVNCDNIAVMFPDDPGRARCPAGS